MDDKLNLFYQSLTANPNIKGLPSDFETFSRTLQDPAKSEMFYQSLRANPNIKGIPESYDEFVNGLAIKAGGVSKEDAEAENILNLDELAKGQQEWLDKNAYLGEAKQNFHQATEKSLQKGGLALGQMAVNIPQGIEAIANAPMRMFADAAIKRELRKGTISQEDAQILMQEKDLWVPKKGLGATLPSVDTETIGNTIAEGKVAKWFDDNIERKTEEITRWDKSATDYFKSGQYGKALEATIGSIAESLPMTVAAMFVPGGAAFLGAGTGSVKYDEIKDREDMTEAMKMADAVMTGTFEWLFEWLGTEQMGKMLKSYYMQKGGKGIEQLFTSDAMKGIIAKGYKRFGLWFAPVHEGLSEGLTTIGQNAASKFSGENPEVGLFDNVPESIVVGAGMGGVFTMTTDLAKKVKDGEFYKGEAGQVAGPLNMPQDPETQIRQEGQKYVWKGGDPNVPESNIVKFASLKDGRKVVLTNTNDAEDEANMVLTAYDANDPAGKPFMVKGTDVMESKDVPYDEWVANELNQYNATKQNLDKQVTTAQSPYQPGQTIEYQGKKWGVADVNTDGSLIVDEITEDGIGASAQIKPEDFNKIIGAPAQQGEVIPGETGSTPQMPPNAPVEGQAVTEQPQKPQARKISDGKAELTITPQENGNYVVDQVYNTQKSAETTKNKLQELYPKVKFEVVMQDSGDPFTPDEYRIHAVVPQKPVPKNPPPPPAASAQAEIPTEQEPVITPVITKPVTNPEDEDVIETVIETAIDVDRDLSTYTTEELDNLIVQLEAGMQDILDQGDTERAAKLNELIGRVIDARNEQPVIPGKGLNPREFKAGDFVKSVYDGKIYEVIEPDNKGMAKLRNEAGTIEPWNAYNNAHFVKYDKADVDVIAASDQVDTKPTEAEKKAGNYKKGHVKVQGLAITIENPAGTIRSGVDKDGEKWSNLMNNTYGYFKRTKGKDGDQVDVFLGDNLDSQMVFVVDQVDPGTGKFDEHKVMLGFKTADEARENYLANYDADWKGLGNITTMSVTQFKEWLGNATRTKKPAAEVDFTAGAKKISQKKGWPMSKEDEAMLAKEPQSFEEGVLQFLLGGGRISMEDYYTHFGRNNTERLKNIWMYSKEGISLDKLNEVGVFQRFPNLLVGMEGAMDQANAFADILRGMAGRNDVRSRLRAIQEKTDAATVEVPLTEDDERAELINMADETVPDAIEDPAIMSIFEQELSELGNTIESLRDLTESDPDYFKVFPYGLNENQFNELKKILNDTGRTSKIQEWLDNHRQGESRGEGDTAVTGDEGAEGRDAGAQDEEGGPDTGTDTGEQPAGDIIPEETPAPPEDDIDRLNKILTLNPPGKSGIEQAREIAQSIYNLESPAEYLRELNLPKEVERFFNSLKKSETSSYIWSVYGRGFRPFNGNKINDFFAYVNNRVKAIEASILEKKGFDVNLVEKADANRIWFTNGVFLSKTTGSHKGDANHFYAGTQVNLRDVVYKKLMALVSQGLITEEQAYQVDDEVKKEVSEKGTVAIVTPENVGEFNEAAVKAYLDELTRVGKMDVLQPGQLSKDIAKYFGIKTYFDDTTIYLNKPVEEVKPEVNPEEVPQKPTKEKQQIQNLKNIVYAEISLDDHNARIRELKAIKEPTKRQQSDLKAATLAAEHTQGRIDKYLAEIDETVLPKDKISEIKRLIRETEQLNVGIGQRILRIQDQRDAKERSLQKRNELLGDRQQEEKKAAGEQSLFGGESTFAPTGNNLQAALAPFNDAIKKAEEEIDRNNNILDQKIDLAISGAQTEIRMETPPEEEEKAPEEVTPLQQEENESEDEPMTDEEIKQEQQDLLESEKEVNAIRDFGAKIGGARKDLELNTDKRSGNRKDATPQWMKHWKLGKREDGTFQPFKVAGDGPLSDRVVVYRFREIFKTEAEAIQAIQLTWIASKFKIGTDRNKKYEVYRKAGERKRHTMQDGFETMEDAYKWMIENADMLINFKPAFPERPHIDNIQRTGKEYRKEDVTTAQFQDTFGFTGGEFGNWVPQDERQRILNYAFDGLMDLADILGVPPRALSMNGQLSIAFGARGQGLSKAAAHYERNRAVFNLTRINGAGSVAHEWFHALDHYLMTVDRGVTLEKDEKGIVKASKNRDTDYLSHGGAIRSKARPEVTEAFKKVLDTIYKQPKIVEVSLERFAARIEEGQKQVDMQLNGIRNYLTRQRDWGKKKSPATPAQQQRLDTLLERIKNRDYGDPAKIETKSRFIGSLPTTEVFKALNELYVEIAGHSAYKYSEGRRSGAVAELEQRIKYLDDAKSSFDKYSKDNKEERNTPTKYYYDAKDIDAMRASDYWTTEHEMAARAFESWVESNLDERGQLSQYLVHSTKNSFYKIFGLNPYPEGVEKERIDAAFKRLFTILEAVTDEKGQVGLHEPSPEYITSKGVYKTTRPPEFPEGLSYLSEASRAATARQGSLWESDNYDPTPTSDRVTYFERILVNRGQVNFIGAPLTGTPKITSPADVAFLFKNLEDAATENAFAVHILPDGNYQVQYLSTSGTTSTLIDVKLIVAAAKELGSQSVTLVHNHPSGRVDPSESDKSIQGKLLDALTDIGVSLNDGVIIDTDQGIYGVFSHYNERQENYSKQDYKTSQEVDVLQFERTKLYIPSTELTKIGQSKDVAEYLSKMKRGTTPKLHAIILNRQNNVTKYLLYDESIDSDQLAKELVYEISKHGESAVIASNKEFNSLFLQRIKYALKPLGSQLLDAIVIKQADDIVNNYKSLADEGLINEPTAPYQSPQDVLNDQIAQFRISDDVYFSPIEKALEAIKQEKGTPQQWKAMLLKNGAKQAELDWMGWDDLASSNPSLTKDKIAVWVAANKIEIKEVEYKTGAESVPFENWSNDELIAEYAERFPGIDVDGMQSMTREELLAEMIGDDFHDLPDDPLKPKYSQYQLPGGEDYQELLLTMPLPEKELELPDGYYVVSNTDPGIAWPYYVVNREGVRVPDTGGTSQEGAIKKANQLLGYQNKFYKSKHWDESNVLAHVRFNTRRTDDGRTVLFIEEIQSDWAQQGKRTGFENTNEKRRFNTKNTSIEKDDVNGTYFLRYDNEIIADSFAYRFSSSTPEQIHGYLLNVANEMPMNNLRPMVADMPFKQTDQWAGLALRRMIRYAIDNGYDAVAWTPGSVQNERYDLSKQVDEITYSYNTNDEIYKISVHKDGNVEGNFNLTENELEGTVGKEIAQKMINGESTKEYSTGVKSLSGIDLKVGGKGMIGFYDTILPSVANKIGKKFGSQTITGSVQTSKTVEFIRIQPDGMATVYDIDDNPLGTFANRSDAVAFANRNTSIQVHTLPITDQMLNTYREGIPLFRAPQRGPERRRDVSDYLTEDTDRRERDMRGTFELWSDRLNTKINVVGTREELPAHIKRIAERDHKNSRISGIYDPATDQVYVVLAEMRESEVMPTILHEIVAHKGLKMVIGEGYSDMLRDIYDSMSQNEISRIAHLYKTDNKLIIADEYLGHMAEQNIEPSLFKRTIARIRQWFRRLFKINFSANDIHSMLLRSRRNLEKQMKPKPKDFETPGEYIDALTAWHGSPYSFDKFSTSRIGTSTGLNLSGYGLYFTDKPEVAKAFAEKAAYREKYLSRAMNEVGTTGAEWVKKALYHSRGNHEKALTYLREMQDKYNEQPKIANRLARVLKFMNKYPLPQNRYLYEVMFTRGKGPNDMNWLSQREILTNAQAAKISQQLNKEGINNGTLDFALWSTTPAEKVYDLLTTTLGSAKEASNFLLRAGIDGIKLTAANEGTTYLLFNDEGVQIKDKVQFRIGETEDPEDPNKPKGPPKNILRTKRELRSELWQNRMLAIREWQNKIRGLGGKITEISNPYRQENLSHGMVKNAIQTFDKEQGKELLSAAAEIMTKGNMSYAELQEYMQVKHAPERNNSIWRKQQIAAVLKNPDLTPLDIEFMVDKLNTTEAPDETNFSGYTTIEAREKAANFESRLPQDMIDRFWSSVRNATDFTIKRWLADGFIDMETYLKIKKQFQYYVPLRGWQPTEADDFISYQTEDIGKTVNPMRRAFGRKTRAEDPMQYIFNMAHTAVVTGEKNRIKQHAARLVKDNKDMKYLHRFKKVYAVWDGTYDEKTGLKNYTEVSERPDEDLWKRGMVRQKFDLSHTKRRPKSLAQEHEIDVFINGEKYTMVLPADVANALNKTPSKWDDVAFALREMRIGQFTRWMSANLTSKNPVFIPINQMRDLQYATLAHFIKGSGPEAAKFIKILPKARRAIIQHLNGKGDPKDPIYKMYQDFMVNGGETGYVHLKDIDQLAVEINKELSRLTGKNSSFDKLIHAEILRKLGGWMEHMAIRSENLSRFATYLVAKEQGKTDKEAAYEAKEITVNFNRKGRISSLMGSLYAFFNASIQGGDNVIRMGKQHSGKFFAIGAAGMAMGFLNAMYNSLWGGDDDDDEDKYAQINDYLKYNNFIFMIPGVKKYISVPLPHGFRWFNAMGVLAYQTAFGQKEIGAALKDGLSNAFAAVSPVNPVEFLSREGELTFRPLVPTTAMPIYDIFANQTYTGAPVHKEAFTRALDGRIADSSLGMDNVNTFVKGFTDFLFKIGGGDPDVGSKFYEDENGQIKKVTEIFDVNPSNIEHVIESWLGGRGMFWNDVLKTSQGTIEAAHQLATEDKSFGEAMSNINSNTVPILKSLVREPWRKTVYTSYYDIVDDIENYRSMVGMQNKAIDPGEEEIEMSPDYQYKADLLTDLRKDLKGIDEDLEGMTDPKQIQELKDVQELLIRNFVEAVSNYNEQ
jgi:DNA repair protein RadC